MTLRVALLGPVVVERDGVALPLPTRQAARLLTVLAASPGTPVATPVLIDAIWGGTPPATAANTLQVHVSTLRRVVGRDAVVTVPGGYLLDVAAEDVDEAVFTALVERAARAQGEGHLGAARDAYREALALWRGVPFADVDAPGLAARRDRLVDLAQSATEELLACRLELARDPGELAAVVADAHGLVAAAPLRERRRALLVRGLAAAGRPGESTQAYLQAAETLREELGLDPGPELREAHAAALRQDPDVLPRAWRVVNRVPAALSPLVDRDDELGQIRAALMDPAVRLVTLTGPPGSGKTRLAMAAAEAQRDDAPGGVVMVELRLAGGGSVVEAVSAALGVDARAAVTGGTGGWGRGPSLLVVDDVVGADDVAGVVALLRAHPRLTVLATAPRALAVAGERVVPVTGLRLPDDDRDQQSWLAPAVALFAARAEEVGARLDSADLPAVVALCRRLDGLPLALELVAARAADTPVRDLLRRDTVDLVGTRRYDDSGRLRSLLDAIDDSLGRLDGDAQLLFRAAGQLPDGLTHDVATVVLDDPDAAAAAMTRLLESHLAEPGDGTAQARIRLSETLAARARDLTDEVERARLRDLLRLALARARVHLLPGPGAVPTDESSVAAVLAEADNLTTALGWDQPWPSADVQADVALLVAAAALAHGEPVRGRAGLVAAADRPGLSADRGALLAAALDTIAASSAPDA